MAIYLRIKEERQRLGLSQTAFASLAGVTKSAQIKWESGASSAPTAPALAAWAEAGADVLYMLTGKRTNDRQDNAVSQIEDQLAGIRRDIIEPGRHRLPGEDDDQVEKRVLERHASGLAAILNYDTEFLTPELREEVENLQDIVTNPSALSLYRAADFAQMRIKRREMKARLAEWFDSPALGETVANLLATLAIDYNVPVKFLAELVHELGEDIAARAKAAEEKMRPRS